MGVTRLRRREVVVGGDPSYRGNGGGWVTLV
jgi:hypothetical protein